MFKKLLLFAVIVLGLIYGSGSDLATIKRQVTGAAHDNARNMTANDNGGWADTSGY